MSRPSASVRPHRALVLSLNGSSRSSVIAAADSSRRYRLDLAGASVSLANRLTAELSVIGREQEGVSASHALQRSLRVRADHHWRRTTLSLGGTHGVTLHATTPPRAYREVMASARTSMRAGSVATFVTVSDGRSLLSTDERVLYAGADASLRLSGTTDVVASYMSTRIAGAAAERRSVADVTLTQGLRGGSSVRLRMRIMDGQRSAQERGGVFLEYGVPLHLPIARARTRGRVEGRIVDAESGRGVANALVRVGNRVGITDSRGRVAFAQVAGGAHRVSLAQEHSVTDAVFIGDPTLTVDSSSSRPASFQLKVARGARVDVIVRRFAIVRTALDGGSDSLAFARAESDVTLRLVSGRDTLYRSTDAAGRLSFTDVPPGQWIVSVHSEAPSQHRFDPDRLELTLAPGERRSVELRLVPRQREIRVIGGDQELRPTTREPTGKGRSN